MASTEYTHFINTSNTSGSSGSVGTSADMETIMNDAIGIWLTGCFCLLGLIGNVVSFVVLKRAFGEQSPMFHVLRALSVSDSVFLLAVFVVQTAVNAYQYIGLQHLADNYRGYIQYAVWPLLMTTQMTTVWLTVLVSGERYVAICRPLHAATVCTVSRVRVSVLFIFLLSILFNIPRYLEFQVDQTGSVLVKSDVGNTPAFRIVYSCVLYALALFLVPLALLICLNVCLVLALRRGRAVWTQLHVSQRREHWRQRREQTLTAIPLTIVLVFFACGTPSLTVNVLESVDPDLSMRFSSFITLMVVANFLVVINSASNIIIYCLVGSQFRSKLVDVLTTHCARCRCTGSSSTQSPQHTQDSKKFSSRRTRSTLAGPSHNRSNRTSNNVTVL